MPPVVLIVGTLDTKAREVAYLKDRITENNCDTVIMDVGIFAQSDVNPEISREQVANAAGRSIAEILALKDRKLAVFTMMLGGAVIARRLREGGRVSGVISIAGGTGTHIATAVMRDLPVGIPKLMVSTVASRDVSPIVGGKDITLMNAVVDLFGDNHLTRNVLAQAAGAIAGMVHARAEPGSGKPVVGLTSFGPLNDAAMASMALLEGLGYEVVPFHAIGAGGTAMEALIEQGEIHGVLDLAMHELADHLHRGYCGDITEQRMATNGPEPVPRVILPGGLDIVAFEGVSLDDVPEALRTRKFASHDFRSFVRTSAQDYQRLAGDVAQRLERLEAAVTIVIPLKGWSKADTEGSPFYEPETNQVFLDMLKPMLPAKVKVIEVDANINDDACVTIAVHELHTLMTTRIESYCDKRS